MPSCKTPRFGGLPPSYNFMFNPYPGVRLSRCPYCPGKTGQRKIPLLVHVVPEQLITVNYTCRYCPSCDLLIAHKLEFEHLLYNLFRHLAPEVVGNPYLVIGTVEKKAWREGMHHRKALEELLPHASDFVTHYKDLRLTRPGWYREDQEPPVMEPPPSQEWVKAETGHGAGHG